MSKNINDLRESMFEILQLLKDKKITVEEAKAMSEIGQTIINSAKVEVEFAKATGSNGSGFIDPVAKPVLPNGVTGITVHRIAG